jgi:transglutaminase-like putative cysteine protease
MVNGESFRQGKGWPEIEGTAYFLTQGRKGVCGDYAWTTAILFDLKGYYVRTMRSEFEQVTETGYIRTEGHVWAEVIIDGEIYVIDFGSVMPQEEYYQAHTDWKIFINCLNNWP